MHACALLALHDTQFLARACFQDLKSHFRALLLEHYRASNKVKPTRLIFYRDGVSEGQFAEVRMMRVLRHIVIVVHCP